MENVRALIMPVSKLHNASETEMSALKFRADAMDAGWDGFGSRVTPWKIRGKRVGRAQRAMSEERIG